MLDLMEMDCQSVGIIGQDKVEVFCIETGVTKQVEKKFIKELPDKYKEKDMTKVFRISLEGVRPARG